jgi:hypothetical protein
MEDGKDEPNWNNFNKYLVIQSPGEQELRLVPWVGRRLGSLIGLMFMPRFSLLRTNEKPRNGTPRNLPSSDSDADTQFLRQGQARFRRPRRRRQHPASAQSDERCIHIHNLKSSSSVSTVESAQSVIRAYQHIQSCSSILSTLFCPF